jgi:hypothetical protein
MARRHLVPHRAVIAGLGIGIIITLILAQSASMEEPAAQRIYPPEDFTSVEVAATARPKHQGLSADEARPEPAPVATPVPTPRPTRKPRPPRPKAAPVAPRTSHVVRGVASWYCKAGVSVCHYAYPPGSMVAAACAPLRAAIGQNWRGRTVVVINRNTNRRVIVTLVDWCGSKTKTIDLYWLPMSKLGGSGVLPVTIRW